MDRKDTPSRILSIVGTVMVWIPIFAPVVFGFASLVMDGIYRFDYLMPAELGILAFIGGALLLWGAIRAKSRQAIIAWGLGIAVGSIAILNVFGDVAPGSWKWALAVGLLITYSAAIVATGVGGVLLWRYLSREQPLQ